MTKTGLRMKRTERRNATVVLFMILGSAIGNRLATGECRSCQSHHVIYDHVGASLPGSGCSYCEKGFDLWWGYCFETKGGYQRMFGHGSSYGGHNAHCFASTDCAAPCHSAPIHHSQPTASGSESTSEKNGHTRQDSADKEEAPEPADVEVPNATETAPTATEVELPPNHPVESADAPAESAIRSEADTPSNDGSLPKNAGDSAVDNVPDNPLDMLPKNDIPDVPPNSVKKPRRVRTISRRTGSKYSTSRLIRHLQHVSKMR